jgi:coproporphyrinogen III oxidase-like Fe-S oxidoreductase
VAGCRSLPFRPPDSLSLYVHILFCRSKCPYCDFFSVAEPEPEAVERVLDQIELQLQCFAQALAPTRVETVYVGGGTPSLLPPRSLDPSPLCRVDRGGQSGVPAP